MAEWEPWWVVIVGSDRDPAMITDHLILHELTHARKDTNTRTINHTFRNYPTTIKVDWRGFQVKEENWNTLGFQLLEEAGAEYIAASFNKHNNRFNPGYFALLTWMRHLEKTKNITPQQVAQAIDDDNYEYIINMCWLTEDDNRAEKIFVYVSNIYRLPLDENGYPEKNLNKVQEKVTKFIQENPLH